MNSKLRVIVVDDELPARKELIYLLEENFTEYVEIIGEAENGLAALEKINKLNPHCVFLDIQMPGINGLDVAQAVYKSHYKTALVFITAYDEYAINAFEFNAIDYLVKPFSLQRLQKTLYRLLEGKYEYLAYYKKIEELLTGKTNALPQNTQIPCEDSGRIYLVKPSEIFYCSADEGKVTVHCKRGKFKTFFNLQELENRLTFFRAHRSYLVNIDFIKVIEPLFHGCCQIILDDEAKTAIPVSRIQTKRLKELFGI
ncbi:MAG: LytR/AlgR family response regulator transcription factor [Bacillota bacterium]